MASTLSVSKIQGLSTAASPTTVEIASGHKITGAAGAISVPGAILQAKHTFNPNATTNVAITSTSFVALGVSLSITPASTSNKILAIFSCPMYAGGGDHHILTLYRDSTNLGHANWGFGASSASIITVPTGSVLDSPNTTSSVTYALYHRTNAGQTAYGIINSGKACITLLEIAQ